MGSNFGWSDYPKIYALGHRALKDLLRDEVLVEEKIDSSQFNFGRFNGELYCRSKGATVQIDAPDKMFAKAMEVVSSLPLHEGWIYRAEYLRVPKHNVLAYDRTPNNNLIIFDINTGLEDYLDYGSKQFEAQRLGLETVPCLFYGNIDNIDHFRTMLEGVSVLGGQKIEGMVVKNYHRFGMDGKVLLGKFVSEAFKEVHKKEWGENNPGQKDIIQRLIETYRTPARWSKAVQHVRERGELENEPKDIGKLFKEAQADLQDECADEIKEMLYKWAIGHVLRGTTAGLAEWYKDELLKKQFEEPLEVRVSAMYEKA